LLIYSGPGDEEAVQLWKRFRDLSIKKYEQTYSRLNIHFDVYAGESIVQPSSITKSMDTLREKGLLTTKTIEESNPDWVAKRATLEQETASSSEENLNGKKEQPEPDSERPLALAVDLKKWKLDKPVVQKSGT